MTYELAQALEIAAIGLPVMIAVIGVFILLAKLLLVVFPHRSDEV
ncbi:MAG: hypothetical protein DDT20_00775 [Firmicutes bacterium]|nr:hypothetical protein [Bacillota bacterium]